jgi:Ulp1 family protease
MDNNTHLSYKSIYLSPEDINCFNDYNLLNDMCISFYYQLINEKFADYSDKFLLLEPAMVGTIVFDDEIEDLKLMLDPLGISQKEYIFFPINDNEDRFNFGGGDHWALAIYQKSTNSMIYLDSMLDYINNNDIIATKLKGILDLNEKVKMISPDIDKLQTNSYDCGMFVLCFTEHLLELLKENDFSLNLLEENLNNTINPVNINENKIKNQRKAILNKIKELSKNNNK